MQNNETQRLDAHAATYRMESAQDDTMRRLAVRTLSPFFRGGDALELGCSNGYMTQMLAPHFTQIDVVEGALSFIEIAKARGITNATFAHSLFDAYAPSRRYDAVFASYILTHVPDDAALLTKIRDWLKPEGQVFIVVPNVRVLSRQLAIAMGFITDLKSLTQNDQDHGHCRAYDRVALNRVLETAGFEIIAQGGIMLKPLADFQMDGLMEQGVLQDAQIEGLYKLGLEYPDLCSALYAVAQPKRR